MRTGRPRTMHLTLTLAAREALAALQRRPTTPLGLQRRARLILLHAHDAPVTVAALALGLSRNWCYKWLKRWQSGGLAGLYDKPKHPPREVPALDYDINSNGICPNASLSKRRVSAACFICKGMSVLQ